MRLAGNFNPEWGYLAPAPIFMRAARAVVVATAIGAPAGAAVVFSLVDGPRGEETVAARTLVRPVDSGLAVVSTPASIANVGPASPAASEWSASSTTQRPANIAASAESPPAATDTAPAQARTATTVVPSVLPQQKKPVPIKKPHYASRSTPRYDQPPRGPFAFLRPFGDRSAHGAY